MQNYSELLKVLESGPRFCLGDRQVTREQSEQAQPTLLAQFVKWLICDFVFKTSSQCCSFVV